MSSTVISDFPPATVEELFISTNAASTDDNRLDLKANLNQILFEISAYASRQYISSTCPPPSGSCSPSPSSAVVSALF